MEQEDSLLQIQNLQIQFKLPDQTVDAVKGISFEVGKGEILGIVGESGSGKSVSSLAIMQLLEKNAIINGKILFQSTDLLKCSKKEIQQYRGNRISMIFQEPMSALNPIFRCGEQVVEVLEIHQKADAKAAKQIVLDWFKKVQLTDVERIFNAYPHQLSGGQLQRVMIAMAMCCEPDLLIADEPTTALDVQVQKSILDLIADLQKEQELSVIFISHDLAVVAHLADRVLVMKKGEIVESGRVKQIFHAPQHPYTKGLLACRPPIDKKLHRLPTIDNYDLELKTVEDTTDIVAETLLKVENISTWFTNKRNWLGRPKSYVKAVNDVSFELKKGQTLALVGESGSGKTTLGRSVLRLIEPQKGEIIFEGESVTNANKKELRQLRKDMQIIFQNPYAALNPRKPIGYAITEPMNVHGISNAKEKTLELLELVGLQADHFVRYPHEFSGGQRQRICIARALAVNPKFIVCDECVSSLDVSVQAQVLNLLKDLQEQLNLSYLFITHDLSVVRFMADQILVMKSGEIVEQGTPTQIFDNAKNPYTQTLLAAVSERTSL